MQAAIPFPDISPEIFAVTVGGFTLALRWYALAYIVGLLVGWRLAVAAVRRGSLWPAGRAPITPGQLEEMLTAVILGVIVGGRLGYVLFYQPGYYAQHPAEALAIWQGGMSFHGGMLGVAVAGLIFASRHGIDLRHVLDILALATPPGLLLGRVANFINAELWGRPSDLPWAVIFPGERAQDCPGVVGLCARHPSQLYEAGLEGLVLGLILIALVWAAGLLRRPGALTGVFLIGYGVARSVVELFRQPDAQFMSPGSPMGYAVAWGELGLTMGQVLSLPMIALGAALILAALRRDAAPA